MVRGAATPFDVQRMIQAIYKTHNGHISQSQLRRQLLDLNINVAQSTICRILAKDFHDLQPKTRRTRTSPNAITDRDTRLILKMVKDSGTYGVSTRQIALEINARRCAEDTWITHQTVWRKLKQLQSDGVVVYATPQAATPLTKQQRDNRLAWAKKMLESDVDWSRVFFIDKKRWRTHGPDSKVNKQWMCVDHPVRRHVKQQGGLSFMSILAFNSDTRLPTSLLILAPKDNVNADLYGTFLKQSVFKRRRTPVAVLQDNARAHRNKKVDALLQDRNTRDMQLPACTPQANLAEDVWAYMSRLVYGRNRTFSTLPELETQV